MEDLKAYIESGILELYVLGDVRPEEKLQVERMAAEHPAIKAELTDIELALESYAYENAIEPSENQRNKILNSLLTNLGDDRTFDKKEAVKNNVIALSNSANGNFYKYAFAASIALLIASIVALVNVYSQLQRSNSRLLALNAQNQQYSKTVNFMHEELNVFHDPSYKLLKLQGTPKTPTASMTVAWNPVKRKVMIDMSNMKLPENDKTHQYQLWALVAGKPVDLGVFDKTSTDTTDMKEMKSIALADAFAVTLEPKGGSVNPTMDEMMVIGKF